MAWCILLTHSDQYFIHKLFQTPNKDLSLANEMLLTADKIVLFFTLQMVERFLKSFRGMCMKTWESQFTE